LGPQEVLLNREVRFDRQLTVEDMETAVGRLEGTIRDRFPDVKQIFLAADSLAGSRSPEPATNR
jgi:hypothetical protein